MSTTQQLTNSKSPAQLRKLFWLLKHSGIDREGRAQLVFTYTEGRSSSAADLTGAEAAALISALHTRNSSMQTLCETMRRKIISMAHEMGWRREGGRIDMEHVYSWVDKYGYLHKNFNRYSYQELAGLVSQFEEVYKHFLKTLQK